MTMTLQEALDNWAIFKFDLGTALTDNDVQVDQTMFDALDVIERAAKGVLAVMRGDYEERPPDPAALNLDGVETVDWCEEHDDMPFRNVGGVPSRRYCFSNWSGDKGSCRFASRAIIPLPPEADE